MIETIITTIVTVTISLIITFLFNGLVNRPKKKRQEEEKREADRQQFKADLLCSMSQENQKIYEELKKHKLSFYIGSILPDCKPSFVYKRHEISGTFPLVKKNIEYLVEGKKNHTPKRKRMYYKNLGEITHYVADYFTFPHNKTYPGSLKDHCAYEEKLKQDLRAFLKTEKAKQIGREKDRDFASLEELFSYVKQQHEAYLKKRSNVEKDIEHIVVINRQLVDAIAQLFHNHKSHHKMA